MNWYTLKFLPDNRFVKYIAIWLFLIPIMAKTLESICLSIPINLFFLFLAALCFTVANIFYWFFCPSIIKDHITASGFINDLKTNDHLEKYAINIKYKDYTKPFINDIKCLSTDFWEIHKKAQTSRSISLYICFIIYFLGFLSLGWVIYTNTVWLIDYFYQTNSMA